MTTPPLDLTALRDAVAQHPTLQTWGSPLVARLIDRAEAAEKKVAAVRGITKRLHAEYDALMREGFPDGPNRVDEADDLAYLIDAALDGGA